MGNRSGTSPKRRRRLLIAASVALLVAVITWLCWPRIDPRFVGTWSDGKQWMVIRSDGYADAFFGRRRKLHEPPKAFLIERDGKMTEADGAFRMEGRIKIRTSGNHFQVAIPNHQTNTISGALKYLLAILKPHPTETIYFDGTVVTLSDVAMALEFDQMPGVMPTAVGEPVRKCSVECHRIEDVPFGTERPPGTR